MSVSERPLAEQLARDVLRDPSTYGWLAPLAREYLKAIERETGPLVEVLGEPAGRPGSVLVTGTRESGP